LISTPTPPKRKVAIKTPTPRKRTPRQTVKHNREKIADDKSNEMVETTATTTEPSINTTQRKSRQVKNTTKSSESIHTSKVSKIICL
jgi:hypothetical protein